MLSPLKTIPAELVKTNLRTSFAMADAITVLVPSTLTFQYKAASSRPCCGEAVWIIQVAPLCRLRVSRVRNDRGFWTDLLQSFRDGVLFSQITGMEGNVVVSLDNVEYSDRVASCEESVDDMATDEAAPAYDEVDVFRGGRHWRIDDTSVLIGRPSRTGLFRYMSDNVLSWANIGGINNAVGLLKWFTPF